MPSSGIEYLARQFNLNDSKGPLTEDVIVDGLICKPDFNNVLVTTYKSLLKYHDLLPIWKKLLERGQAIQHKSISSYPTLLIELVQYGYAVEVFADALKDMLDKDAEHIINQCDADGNTPLMIAAENGNQQVVSLLLQYGARTELTNKAGKTAADLAADMQRNMGINDEGQYQNIRQALAPKSKIRA